MGDPCKLFFRLILALFKIAGYFFAFLAHTLWCFAHGRPEHAGDATGDFGRGVTDAIAAIFEV
jgi:hypothetical protein